MKRINSSTLSCIFVGVAVVFMADCELYAQAVRVQPNVPAQQKVAQDVIRVRKVTDLSREYQSRTPIYVTGSRSAKEKIWGVFDVTFDVQGDWIDNLTVEFSVLLYNQNVKQGEKQMSLYKVTSVYSDIMGGRERKVGVVLSPAALLRYGVPIGFAAQFTSGGQTIAVASSAEGHVKGVENWWENPKVIDSPNVARRSGHLQERSKSVFALSDIDSYEVEQ